MQRGTSSLGTPASSGANASIHITLIRPPAISSRHAYSTPVVPPLGPAYVAAALQAAGHTVAAIDALGEAPLEQHPAAFGDQVAHGLAIEEIVARIPPGTSAIGVSVTFSQQWPHTAAIIAAVHAAHPAVPILVGGEHPTAMWEYILEASPGVTLCVLGEGEETAVEIANCIARGDRLNEVPGIAIRTEGRPARTRPRARTREVDTIARPAWHLFPLENYLAGGFGHGVNRGRSIPMLATRGCPYQCTFCSSPEMWTTSYYVRPPEAVVDEIADYVARYQISNVDFEDLTMFIKRDWILKFCGEIERRGLRVTFQLPTGTRSEALDEETLTVLARAGCTNLTYAPESGAPSTLREIKKKVHPDRLLASMRIAKRLGINVKANLMIGFPHETRAELFETLIFGIRAAWVGVDDIPLFPFSPYPGTPLYAQLRQDGVLPPPSDSYFASLGYMDVMDMQSVCRNIGTRELNFYRVVGMAVFYILSFVRHPWRVVRTVRNVRNRCSETVLEQRIVEHLQRRDNPARRNPAITGSGDRTEPRAQNRIERVTA